MSDGIYCTMKFIFLVYIICKLGYLFGLFCFFILYKSFKHMMKIIFGLEMLGSIDRSFIGKTNKEKINIIAIANFEDFDADKFRNIFIERVISKIPKFRKKLINKFGNYYWQDVSIESAKQRVIILKNDKLNNESDVLKYVEEDINLHLDSFKELPYMIKIIPYGTSGSVLFKFDHVFSDGLGLISTVCAMADNYDTQLFPALMRNFKFKWYHEFFDWLSFIYYGPQTIYSLLSANNDKSPFRSNPHTSGITRFTMSKLYDLDKFSKIRNELKISFNDLIMCLLARVSKRICNINNKEYKDVKNFTCFMPIGKKGVPEKIEDVKVNNELYGIYIQIPLIDNIKEKYSTVVTILKKSIKNIGIVSASTRFAKIGFSFLPIDFMTYLTSRLFNNIDMIVTNVPGPTSQLYYGGCKLTMISPIVSTRNARALLPIFSYNKKFRFVLNVDEESGIDNDLFISLIDEEMKNLLVID